jgi:uncharacterized protein (DUF488 family)
MAVLHTIGYEGRTLADVVALLREARISVLLDVREVAWSHKPGFAKKSLAEGLASAGIDYVHAAFAGSPKRLRKSGAPLAEILEGYARHLDDAPEIETTFDATLRDLHGAGRQVAVMCFERDPAECHRGVLAARWKKRRRGTIVHLGTDQLRLDAL